jgi:triacylglycerol lipase
MPNSNGTTRQTLNQSNVLRLYSQVQGPLKSLSFLRRSLVLAELAMIAYLPPSTGAPAAARLGFPGHMFFDHAGAQAYWFDNRWDAVIICRGTEPRDWNDIRANINLWMEVAETVGKVHRGFKREMDQLWPRLEKALVRNRKPLWFAGHSLGGAMATICAGRCKLSFIKSNPEELYTYGSPRVGNQRYVQFTRLRHHRWVNNNDIVPTVPPTWLGYRHCGQEWYLNYEGQLRQLHWSGRLLDNWRGLRESIHLRRFDFVADHSMFNYIAAIEGLCRAEEQTLDGMVAAESIGQFITISESKTVVFSEEVTSPQQNSAIIQTETIRRSA